MDILDYTEAVSAKSLDVLRQSYDDLHERAYKLATVLVAGGGAVGAYAIGKLGENSSALAWAPLAALSLCWFGAAAVLLLSGATSRVLSPGNAPKNIRAYFDDRIKEHPDDENAALVMTRNAELVLMNDRHKTFSEGCIARARAIDHAYRSVVFSSMLVPVAVAAFCYWISS